MGGHCRRSADRLCCVVFIFNESLISYAACARAPLAAGGDAGWFSSMGITLFGGFAAVITGGAYGIPPPLPARAASGTHSPASAERSG